MVWFSISLPTSQSFIDQGKSSLSQLDKDDMSPKMINILIVATFNVLSLLKNALT